jgi:hypothetical protein
VHEQQGGTSSLTFSYRVVAKRKDGQPERLAKLEEPESMPEPRPEPARLEEEGPRQMMRQQPPPPPQFPPAPQPSMMPPSFDFVGLKEEHRRQMDELRRLVEEQRQGMEEEAPPEEST